MSAPTPDVPETPRDRYAGARRALHVIAVLVSLGGIFWWLPWPEWGIMCGMCETVAFALRPRTVGDESTGVLESGMQIGCGGVFGFFAGLSFAFSQLSWNNNGAEYIASCLVGAVVGGALALRFGEQFWNWVLGGRNPW